MNAGDRPGMVGACHLHGDSATPISPIVTPSDMDLKNMTGRSLIIAINVTDKVGAPTSITPTIKGVLPDGTTYTILAGAAITTTGLVLLRVSPDLTDAANLIKKDIVPREVRVTWASAGLGVGAYFTFTVAAITGL